MILTNLFAATLGIIMEHSYVAQYPILTTDHSKALQILLYDRLVQPFWEEFGNEAVNGYSLLVDKCPPMKVAADPGFTGTV